MNSGQYLEILFYDGESSRPFRKLTYDAFIQHLLRFDVPGFTVTRALSGLDAHQRIRQMQSDYLQEDVPVCIQMFIPSQTVDHLIHQISSITHLHCTIVAERAFDLKTRRAGDDEMTMRGEVDGAIVKVYMNETDRVDGVPLSLRLLQVLRAERPLWVDVEHAMEGYGQGRTVHKTRWFSTQPESMLLEVVIAQETLSSTLHAMSPLIEHASGPAILVPGKVFHFGQAQAHGMQVEQPDT